MNYRKSSTTEKLLTRKVTALHLSTLFRKLLDDRYTAVLPKFPSQTVWKNSEFLLVIRHANCVIVQSTACVCFKITCVSMHVPELYY